jgi:heparan-alpha-glucosaminide N-acetyltransferase
MEKQRPHEQLSNLLHRFVSAIDARVPAFKFSFNGQNSGGLLRERLQSIDVFRAVTMLVMIFVNDFWTLEGVPRWLIHSRAEDDAMGLSDAVFPAFLFIVGLAIPYAMSNRKKKGEGWVLILTHIFERTFALLLMGVFIVNYEVVLPNSMIVSGYVWGIAMVIAFLLIWNNYSQSPMNQDLYARMKIIGYVVLVILAVMYKGDNAINPSQMETRWWGILGLIGWSYFLVAPAYLIFGDRLVAIVAVWLFFIMFNLLDFAGGLSFLDDFKPYIWIVGRGSLPAFAMAGVVASVIYRKYGAVLGDVRFVYVLSALGLSSLIYGLITRVYWGISKIQATPAWVGICTGLGFLLFAFFFWLIDHRRSSAWAKWIRPAGSATLTCYLVPYLWYAVITLLGMALPMYLRTGVVGLVKSLIFAYLVIWLTGQLNKQGIRLKI